jgi:hypothetical protein
VKISKLLSKTINSKTKFKGGIIMETLKIHISDSFIEAYKLFRMFEHQITEEEAKGICFYVFSNCREQGIVLTNYHTKKNVLLCDSRWGANLTVYYGLLPQFNITTNLPASEEVWEQRKSFGSKNYEDAKNFIKEWLLTPEPNLNINTYCFRAEHEYDVDELRKLISLRIKKLTKQISYPDYLTEVEIETDLSLEQMQAEMCKVKHGSLMVHTIDYKDQYSGKVKKFGGNDWLADYSMTSTHWIEGRGL